MDVMMLETDPMTAALAALEAAGIGFEVLTPDEECPGLVNAA